MANICAVRTFRDRPKHHKELRGAAILEVYALPHEPQEAKRTPTTENAKPIRLFYMKEFFSAAGFKEGAPIRRETNAFQCKHCGCIYVEGD